MYIIIRKFVRKTQNPYNTPLNANIEPKWLDEECTEVLFASKDSELLNIMDKADSNSSYTYYSAEPIFPELVVTKKLKIAPHYGAIESAT